MDNAIKVVTIVSGVIALIGSTTTVRHLGRNKDVTGKVVSAYLGSSVPALPFVTVLLPCGERHAVRAERALAGTVYA